MNARAGKTTIVIGIFALIVLVGFFALSLKRGLTIKGLNETLSPQERVEREKAHTIERKKADILALVYAGNPLTQEQKAEIYGIMFSTTTSYRFGERERADIFAALSK